MWNDAEIKREEEDRQWESIPGQEEQEADRDRGKSATLVRLVVVAAAAAVAASKSKSLVGAKPGCGCRGPDDLRQREASNRGDAQPKCGAARKRAEAPVHLHIFCLPYLKTTQRIERSIYGSMDRSAVELYFICVLFVFCKYYILYHAMSP